MSRTRPRPTAPLVALLLFASMAQLAAAQQPSAGLVGWIHDSAGAPVDHADVEIEATHSLARTDSAGRFSLRSLEPGSVTVRVRRLGFDPQSFDFVLRAEHEDSVSVTLRSRAHELGAVHTDASANKALELTGFNRRRGQGSGVFITREDIEQHHTNVLSETLRDVPGLRFVHAGTGRQGLRFESSNSKSYDCTPTYWVDGRHVAGAEIDDFPASDVEAIELYRGPATTPLQFSPGRNASCGAVVIWTRSPGTASD